MISRYTKVRTINGMGYGPPLMLDRGNKAHDTKIRPYKCEYWDRARSGFYVPRVAGGVGFSGATQFFGRMALPGVYNGQGTLSQITLALDSNYVAGSSGDAIAARIVLPATKTFDTLYFFITGYTGTAANVNDINLEIRADATGGIPDTTGTIDTDSIDPASATGWITKQFGTPQSLTGGTTYHIIVGDADGNGTDYATVLRAVTWPHVSNFTSGPLLGQWGTQQTTGGWSTGNSLYNNFSTIVATFADGSAYGIPFTTAENPSNNTLARGLLMSGLTETLEVLGVFTATAAAGLSDAAIFSGADLSSATPFATASHPVFNQGSSVNELGFLLAAPVTLAKSSQYRIVFRFAANSTVPAKAKIGTGADATLKSLMFGGGSWYWTIDSAGPVWVDDDDAFPNMSLVVEDQVEVAVPSEDDVRDGVVYSPFTGNLILPTEAQVESGVGFGSNGTEFEGTFEGGGGGGGLVRQPVPALRRLRR